MNDTFRTISAISPEVIYKSKNSKFIGIAFPCNKVSDFSALLETVKKAHPKANHHCFAYRIQTVDLEERANDDGEPTHSAGDPILGQLIKADVINAGIVVVRYFGGVKLGVPGLIKSYKTAARLALEATPIVVKKRTLTLRVQFPFSATSAVMQYIRKTKLRIIEQEHHTESTLSLAVLPSQFKKVERELNGLKDVLIL